MQNFGFVQNSLDFRSLKINLKICWTVEKAATLIFKHALSDRMYESRFELFKNELNKVEIVFDPIVHFDKSIEDFNVWGFEALSRLNGINKAPFHLFYAAELWGTQFQIELDLFVLERAIKKYKEALRDENLVRFNQPMPLSINIYPKTILRSIYFDRLSRTIKEQKISGRNIILELSEKKLFEGENNGKNSLEDFQKIRTKLKRKLKVKIAIDDFGVGHSSIARVSKIMPDFVKIDRELLSQGTSFNKDIIKFIVDSKAKSGEKNFDVIVEGFDDVISKNVSLNELINNLNVEFIQGHALCKDEGFIQTRLTKEKYREVCKIVGWHGFK